MILAKLGDTDITNYINESSYKVNSEPVYNEWTDANYRKHRDEVRRRVTGSFDLAFVNDTQYNSFLTLLNNNKTGNVVSIKLYVGSDINALVDCYCYYKMVTNKRRQANSDYIVTIVTMDLEER